MTLQLEARDDLTPKEVDAIEDRLYQDNSHATVAVGATVCMFAAGAIDRPRALLVTLGAQAQIPSCEKSSEHPHASRPGISEDASVVRQRQRFGNECVEQMSPFAMPLQLKARHDLTLPEIPGFGSAQSS